MVVRKISRGEKAARNQRGTLLRVVVRLSSPCCGLPDLAYRGGGLARVNGGAGIDAYDGGLSTSNIFPHDASRRLRCGPWVSPTGRDLNVRRNERAPSTLDGRARAKTIVTSRRHQLVIPAWSLSSLAPIALMDAILQHPPTSSRPIGKSS